MADDERRQADVPSWVTAELIADTIRTWQPRYKQRLTTHDAIEILMTAGNLVDVLRESDG